MIRLSSIRALTLSAILAFSAPMAAYGAPDNTGGAAEASALQLSQPMAVTSGAATVAENTGNAAQSSGNPLAVPLRAAPFRIYNGTTANRENGVITNNELRAGAQG